MSKKKRFGVSQALSRGLSETISVVENNAGIYRNVILPLSRIELDPDNPRKLTITLADVQQGLNKNDPLYGRKSEELERLTELAVTIKSSGIINPIVVYKLGETYRVVAGERRCLASIIAGKQEIEARIFNEKPKGFALKLIQWIENTAREDLTLDERINNIRDILGEYQNQHGDVTVTPTLLRTITGLSLPQATYYGAVLNAQPDVRQMIESGRIRSLDKAAIITGIDSPELRHEALSACVNGCSLKELRNIVMRGKQNIKKHMISSGTAKRGRSVSRVNMGFTLQTKVIQVIVESVVNRADYKKYVTLFSKVDWTNIDQATRMFKKMIEILEQESERA